MIRPKTDKIIKILFLQIFAALIVFPFVGEIYLRISKLSPKTPIQLRTESFSYEPALFARTIFPEYAQDVYDKNWMSITMDKGGVKTLYTHSYINEKGYRGKIFEAEKPKNVIRVMVYGGSSVFDLAVSDPNDWPHAIESEMKSRGFSNLEVINAGIPGHSVHDAFGRLFAEGHAFKPDYVIIYSEWNDIKFFSSNKTLLRQLKPYVPSNDPFTNYRNPLDQYLCEKSRMYTALRQSFYKLKLKPSLEGSTVNLKKKEELSDLALRQYKLNLEMFVDCARSIGAVPIIMTEANLMRERKISQEPYRLRYVLKIFSDEEYFLSGLLKADEIIKEVSRNKDVYLIDAGEELKERGEKYYFTDHVHVSSEGSKQLGVIVSNHLESILSRKNKHGL
ncbi:MAG: SGNH/GDSL hydrolase family protein [Candidatus Omnitrophica bacterium]|nr:SGNH/GDSL hydrolase family protein [Candidatus Omnitrophota bacterium]